MEEKKIVCKITKRHEMCVLIFYLQTLCQVDDAIRFHTMLMFHPILSLKLVNWIR